MTKLLAIDTSAEACSVALCLGDEVVEHSELIPRMHARKLLPMVDGVLAEANIALTALDAIAFGRGPGSFTGLRIAAGAVQGLAFGADLPTLPISSLAALAQGVHRTSGHTDIVTLLDARMDEIYWACFGVSNGLVTLQGEEHLTAPSVMDKDTNLIGITENWVGVGDGWKLSEQLPEHVTQRVSTLQTDVFPQARDVLTLAKEDYNKGLQVPADQALPVYMRDKTAWRRINE